MAHDDRAHPGTRGTCEFLLPLVYYAGIHKAVNGQSDQSVQTPINSLRTVIGARHDTSKWRVLLPHALHCLNSRVHASTGTSPFELVYGRPSTHFLNPDSSRPAAHDLEVTLRQRHQPAWDTVQLATAHMKILYDARHDAPSHVKEGDIIYVKLAKPRQDGYHLQNQTKLSHRRARPFRVETVISPLRLRLALPDHMTWRPEISIEHLEPAHPDTRLPLSPGPIHREGVDKFIIEKILGKRRRRGRKEFLVRWLGYSQDSDTWEPEESLRQDVPLLLDRLTASRRTRQASN
ncbi:hypothetical protein PWT90_03751 [Aphanocladium album]|nr:hypothetical protein PWT90_03751 [Aphanocladium album]